HGGGGVVTLDGDAERRQPWRRLLPGAPGDVRTADTDRDGLTKSVLDVVAVVVPCADERRHHLEALPAPRRIDVSRGMGQVREVVAGPADAGHDAEGGEHVPGRGEVGV